MLPCVAKAVNGVLHPLDKAVDSHLLVRLISIKAIKKAVFFGVKE